MADKEQNTELTQKEQGFLDRIGIVLRGTKEIAAYMRVSPATIVRWRRRVRGREEIRLCFPAFLMPTGRGHGVQLWSHTASIKEWMERWSQIDCAEAQGKARWRRRTPRMKRLGETRKESAGHFREENEQRVREAAQLRPTTHEATPAQRGDGFPKVHESPAASQPPQEPCPCGVPSRCLVHHEWPLEKDGARPPVKVEIRPEPSGAAEPPPAKVSKNVRPESCTCGTLTTCIAHD